MSGVVLNCWEYRPFEPFPSLGGVSSSDGVGGYKNVFTAITVIYIAPFVTAASLGIFLDSRLPHSLVRGSWIPP